MKMNRKIIKAAAAIAVCLTLAACGGKNSGGNGQTAAPGSESSQSSETMVPYDEDEEYVNETFYTGRTVENEEDRAIYKLSCTPPEGYDTIHDDGEGKQFASKIGGITVKAQNFKDEFRDLEAFADSGCVSIKLANMLRQADTEFSDPIKTKVAGFDAIRYDYTVSAYFFPPVTDANGEYVMDDEGNYTLEEEKKLIGEFCDRVYYFYSDEDVFYIMFEAPKDLYEQASVDFDKFIESISISKK